MLGRGAALAAAAAVLAPASAAAAQQPPAWLQVRDGVTQRQFPLDRAIRRTVFVRTRLDTDHDGRRDRIRVRIIRPRGVPGPVPVVFQQSPYRGDLGDPPNHDVDVPRGLPGDLDDRYVPRGYAVALGESVGTFHSDGCPDVGGRGEALATKAVIDWLARRPWSSGAVGMVGTSYDGTLANQVATTGVRGLKAIVPVSAISSWYDYYRANGLVVAPHSNASGRGRNDYLGEDTDVLAGFTGGPRMAGRCAFALRSLARRQDRATGDWSAFWQARDSVHRAGRVKAAVLLVHGLADLNVRTKQFAQWWSALRSPRHLWLHRGGHGGPDTAAYARAEIRWFDRWLFGVTNGVESEPPVHIQREDGHYDDEASWPAPGARTATLPLQGERRAFTDRGRTLDTDRDLLTRNRHALRFRTPPLTAATRLSGTPAVDLRMAILNRRRANLTAVLVDYGPGKPVMVTRGWLDPRNRDGVRRGRPVRPGRTYRLRWDLQPNDHVFAPGHRIGLVVVSTDHDYTLHPRPGTRIALDPAGSALRLPLVGPAPAALLDR